MSDVGTSSYYTSNFPLPITNNIFAKINKSRLRKLFESGHRELFQRFFSEYFFAENKLGAQRCEKNAFETECWKINYKVKNYAETYYISTEKVINALHFIRDRYKEATFNFDNLIWEFEAEVFYETNEKQKLAYEKWVKNVRQHVRDINSLLGTNLMDQILSRVLSLEISKIYPSQTSTFNPESQWKIQGIEILRKELFKIKKELFEIKKYLQFGFPERLQRIVEGYIANCDNPNDQSRFGNFISYVATVVDNVRELARKGKVLDLSFIASKEDYFYPLLPQPPEDYESLLPASSKLLNIFGKVKKGFGNPIDFRWNVKCINDWKKDKSCPAVLRKCVKSNGQSEQLRKLNALGKQIFDQNAKKLTDSEHNPTLQIIDFDAGVVAVYKRINNVGEKAQYFLQMISKIANPEKVETDSLKVLFDPNQLVEDFVKREKAYEEAIEEEEKSSSPKYYVHRSDEHKNGSRNNDCWCLKDFFSENEMRASVLRYLIDNPRLKNASTGAAHSIKHYKENAEEGQDWIDRLEILRGVNLKYHIKQYLSTAKRLVEPKLETETEEEWLERQRSKFTYSVGNSGVINVAFGIWSGGNDGIFVHLSITKDKDMFINTLFTGKPASRRQAKCFGLENMRDRGKKSKKPIEVDSRKEVATSSPTEDSNDIAR